MYFMGTHENCLTEAILMSTPKICFYGELTKNYPSVVFKYPPYLFHWACRSLPLTTWLWWEHKLTCMLPSISFIIALPYIIEASVYFGKTE